jgi:hypothetical protein
MSEDLERPNWVKVSLELLRSILRKLGAIKKEGRAEIKRGLEKIEYANRLEAEADYLTHVLSQPHDPQTWSDEIVNASGTWLANRIQALDHDVDSLSDIAATGGSIGDQSHARFLFAFPSTDSSAGTAIYLGAGIEKRFQAIEPAYRPVLQDVEPARLTSRDHLYQELRDTLAEYDDEYVTMLDGSESSLSVSTPDSQSQAAHSMRDCFQQVLEQLAPSKVVASQPWFQSVEGAPGGISRRARLRYMLYGSGQSVNEDTIQKLDDLSEIAKDSLDLCMARAHDHDQSLTAEEVRLVIDQARNALLHVLKMYNAIRGK